MSSISKFTDILRQNFPKWMDIRSKDDSIGAQFLETFGLQFQEIEDYLNGFIRNKFLNLIDLEEVSLIYKSSVHPSVLAEEPLTVTANNVSLMQSEKLQDFYSLIDDIYLIDNALSTIYFRKDYGNVYINGIPYRAEPHQVWNVFDEFGMLLNIYRIKKESNENFKARILDVFKNPPSETKDGLLNNLSRVLNIKKELIDIKSVNELAETEIDIYGNVSPRFISYIGKLNKAVPFTWGTMAWDESYWDTFDNISIDYLPHIYNPDTSMWKQEDFQSGIGDNDDLEIIAPEDTPEEQVFNYRVGLRGTVVKSEEIFVEHQLRFKVYAEGQISNFDKPPKKVYHTVVASEDVPFEYKVHASKNYKRIYDQHFDSGMTKSNVVLVPGNTIMSPNNRYMKIRVQLKTENEDVTPVLSALSVDWYNTSEVKQTLTFDTSEDFTANTATINTDLQSIEAVDGNIEIGKGTYSKLYNTVNSWDEGVKKNAKATREGLFITLRQ